VDWRSELRSAVSNAPAPDEGADVVEVVVGGRTIYVPAPISVSDLLHEVGDTPADTYYICVSAEGQKLSTDDTLSGGERVYLVPVRVDG